MLQDLDIEGYRGLRELHMGPLARINLLVGTNNSGKTSVLEAIRFLVSDGDLHTLSASLRRRGEQVLSENEAHRNRPPELDVCHLFNGHRIEVGSRFKIQAADRPVNKWVTCEIGPPLSAEEPAELFEDEDSYVGPLAMVLRSSSTEKPVPFPLTRRLGLQLDAVRFQHPVRQRTDNGPRIAFITVESLSLASVEPYWRRIALRPEQATLVKALQILEPRLEQIAFVGGRSVGPRWERGGFVVKFSDSELVLPIGSLGDGIWRVLCTLLGMVEAEGGVLLVDEVDTGLHYTVMSGLWKLMNEVSKSLDIQVFATTHSYDCVSSLAAICRRSVTEKGEITIHRLESGRERAVPFSESEIAIAAERDIELR